MILMAGAPLPALAGPWDFTLPVQYLLDTGGPVEVAVGVTVHGPAGSSDGVGRLAKWAMRV